MGGLHEASILSVALADQDCRFLAWGYHRRGLSWTSLLGGQRASWGSSSSGGMQEPEKETSLRYGTSWMASFQSNTQRLGLS
jgi:hypothetical protein